MKHEKVIVLGGGRVGNAIARDLHEDKQFMVTVADYSTEALGRSSGAGIPTVKVDLQDGAALSALIVDYDLVIGAVPGWMGFQTLETVIRAGKNVVDISFFEEDPFLLDELARERGVTAVVDCGVAPGLGNIVLGRVMEEFDSIDEFTCLVGGLPEERRQPWEYMAPYSPVDVLEIYTRPARLRRNGELITMPALTEREIIDFPGVGALEAFNTDGLRTILKTCQIPNLLEKTLRYPGHMEKIVLLRDSGFFDHEPRKVGEMIARPIDVTSSLLFDQWLQGPEDRDLTAMRLVVDGIRQGRRVCMEFDLLDRFDPETGIPSMSRTTGYPCTAVARLISAGIYRRPGISPPEYVGNRENCYKAVIRDLEDRGVSLVVREVDPVERAAQAVETAG